MKRMIVSTNVEGTHIHYKKCADGNLYITNMGFNEVSKVLGMGFKPYDSYTGRYVNYTEHYDLLNNSDIFDAWSIGEIDLMKTDN